MWTLELTDFLQLSRRGNSQEALAKPTVPTKKLITPPGPKAPKERRREMRKLVLSSSRSHQMG